MDFFLALFLTILIELIAILLIVIKVKLTTVFTYVCIANCITLLFVWFVFPQLISSYYPVLILSEIFAVLFEGIFYSHFLKLTLKNGLMISFIANLISFSVGFFIL